MKHLYIIILLFFGVHLSAQIDLNTNFDILSNQPIDNRTVIDNLSDTTSITWEYEGLSTYVKGLDLFYVYNGSFWEVVMNETSPNQWGENAGNVYRQTGSVTIGNTIMTDGVLNIDMTNGDTTGVHVKTGVITAENTIIETSNANGDLGIGLRFQRGEHTLMLSPKLQNLTYGNAKINSSIIVGTNNIASQLTNPFASNIIGFNAVPNCTDCNSMTVSGYQSLFYLNSGHNITANGTDVGYNFRTLTNSNLYGRHIAFEGGGTVEAIGNDLNFFGMDSYPIATSLSNVTAFGNYIGTTAIEVQNSLFFGDQSARYRPFVYQSEIIGTLAANLPTNPGTGSGIFHSSLMGFRTYNNQDSVYYSSSIGYHSFYLSGYNDTYLSRFNVSNGAESGLSRWGDGNTFIGYRAGAIGAVTNINKAVAIGYRAGDLWLGDNELAIDNSETTSPLIYGNFSTNSIKINGSFEVTGNIILDSANNVIISTGTGTPEGSLMAGVGSTFHRSDGGSGTSFYVKESGTGTTGWIAK
jgi:hypothetical protein